MKRLTKYLESLREKGLMDDYSDNHFLIQAFNGKCDFFEKYPHLENSTLWGGAHRSSTFLANFSTKLERLSKRFSPKDIEGFVKNQLAAGKNNYSESQFFRALSEVNVLNYLTDFAGVLEFSEYEPNVTGRGSNPEARLKFKGDITIDVEVKTPGFTKKAGIPETKIGIIKPNVIFDYDTLEKLKSHYAEKDIFIEDPRGLKLQGFIKSASDKFTTPTNEKHYNLLFINWTYTDFPGCGLAEPASLLVNPISGLIHSNKGLEIIGLDRSNLENISAIILYSDNINSILNSDFRSTFENNSSALILNNHHDMKQFDYSILSRMLNMQPMNNGNTINWNLGDYIFRENVHEREVLEHMSHIYDFLFLSDEILSEKPYGAKFWMGMKDMVLLGMRHTKFKQ